MKTDKKVTEEGQKKAQFDRRQFLGELVRRIGLIALGTAAGTVAVDIEELVVGETPTKWLGPEGDYTGV